MLSVNDGHRLERAEKRLNELRAWRHAAETPISGWSMTVDGRTVAIAVGDNWPTVGTPVGFAAEPRIPEEWAGLPVELELWLGGEGLIRLSTGYQAALDPFHHAFPLTERATGGERIAIAAEVVPKGMFGSHVAEPRLERAHLVVPHPEVRALVADLEMVTQACEQLGGHEVVPHLLAAMERAFATVHRAWPTATDVALSRLVLGYRDPLGSGASSLPNGYAIDAWDVRPASTPIWHLPPAPRPLEALPDSAIAAVEAARAGLAAELAGLREAYPPVGRLALTGHAHINLAWLWPVAETRRKGRRTFSSVLNLMERYPDFTFNQSSAQLYAWIEEDDPALFDRIRRRVAEGRWEPVGGSWVEPDCQVTGGESFVRQLLYGQRYFERTFGRRHAVAWLPDVFGFSGAIPQLLRGAGIGGFFTIKLNWNETNRFPHDLFEWEGIDGSRVTANMFRNLPPAHGYNGTIRPLDALGTWRAFDGKRHHPESLLAFGWGDGGGGPTARMLENYQRIASFPALPRLRMASVAEYFASLPRAGLPRWVGELYLELHRGTLTSQARTKRLNREGEHRLLEAEAFAAIAGERGFAYPAAELEGAWKRVLLNQFHDILPGSSIAEVYVDAHRGGEAAVATAVGVRDEALAHLGAGGDSAAAQSARSFLVANAALTPRPLSVVLPRLVGDAATINVDGATVAWQATEEGMLVHAPSSSVPGLGWLTAAVGDGSGAAVAESTVSAVADGDGFVIENDRLRVAIGGDGGLWRLYDKEAAREALAGRGNQLWAWVDKPRVYDAWDIDADYESVGEELTVVARIAAVEHGPLRAAVRVERRWRDSTIVQTYRLLAGSRRLEIATEVDWLERQVFLQARAPVAVRSHEATFETMFGAVRRPTHRNTSWDAARFEVAGHRWADISEPGYGVAILNDGKYGHAVHENVHCLSLLRGPLYPDPAADEGPHRFTYALYPHEGDWTAAGVVAEAFAMNSPLIAVPTTAAGTTQGSFVACGGLPVALGALKATEDGGGTILRLYEPHGARGVAVLRFAAPLARAARVDLLEEPEAEAVLATDAEGRTLSLPFGPFEVVTLRLDFASGESRADADGER